MTQLIISFEELDTKHDPKLIELLRFRMKENIIKGDYVKAKADVTECLRILQINVGKNHPYEIFILRNYANELANAGRVNQALECFNQQLELCDKLLHTSHPLTALLNDQIWKLYVKKSDLRQAIKHFRLSLPLFKDGQNNQSFN